MRRSSIKTCKLLALAAASVPFWAAAIAHAEELDFLETDPRFSGGEVNPSNPSHQNFWFYDQYTNARNALQAAGVNVIPITALTLSAMDADSDAFYVPPPTNPQASTYPMTDQELSVIQQYVGSNHSIIFNLGDGGSSAMDNNLFMRLGLTGTQAPADVSGSTTYPYPSEPSIAGTYGTVNSFTYSGTGYMSSLGDMRDLVDISGKSVIPFIEKGDFGYHQGAYFFILDDSYLTNWAGESASQQNLFLNMVIYATEPWGERYIPGASQLGTSTIALTSAVPEPTSLAACAIAGTLLLRRRKRGRPHA